MKFLKYIVVCLILVSCQKKNETISPDIVQKLKTGSYVFPSKYGTVPLFVITEDGEVIITNADYLSLVYKRNFSRKFKSFDSFLQEVLNEKFKIKKNDFKGTPFKYFKITYEVKNDYINLDFNKFLEKYVEKSDSKNDKLILKTKNLTSDEVNSVSYYFYKNGYHVIFNDVRAQYVVIDRDSIFR